MVKKEKKVTRIDPVRTIPVSYTHLDVYKRQGYDRRGIEVGRKSIKINRIILIQSTN